MKKNSFSEFSFLIGMLFTNITFSQNSVSFTNYHLNGQLNLYQLNPATQLDNFVFGSLQYQSSFGPLSRLNSFEGDFNFSLNKKQWIGIQLWTENEGPFIQRNRLYGSYGLKLALSKNLFLSVGAKAGLINQRYKASTSSPEVARNAFDLGLGISLKSKKVQSGISMNQIPRSDIVLISDITQYSRFIEFYSTGNFKISHSTIFEPFARIRYVPDLQNGIYQLSPNFSFLNQMGSGGVHLLYKQGFSPHAEIHLPLDSSNFITIGFGYFMPLFSKSAAIFPINRYEITIQFYQKNND